MQRFLGLTVALVAGVGGLSAGPIQMVQTQINLSAVALGNTVAGNEGGWGLKNYDTYVFSGANNGSPTVPYAGYQQFQAENGTLPNSPNPPETFQMINSGCAGLTSGVAKACDGSTTNSNNVWAAPINSTGESSTITIPIGIFDVSDVYTVLGNVFGTPGVNDTTVIFNWGNSATVTNGTSLTVNLVNASNNAALNSGQVQSTVDCTVPDGVGTSTCNTMALGGLATSSMLSGINVVTGNVFTQSYNSTIGGSSMLTGSSGGNLNLDDQGFLFAGLNSGLFLVNVQIEENVGKSNTSQTVLSAVTVDSVATPEPASVWLGVAGLAGVIVFARRRRIA